MRRPLRTGLSRNLRAFTLIELLVVVAIIALLISILLPSLGQARAQSRTTLCATRIAQVAKAMMMYASDYDETPPFMGMGQCDWDDMLPTSTKKDKSGVDLVYNWMKWEDWLMPDMPRLWALYQGSIISAPEDEVEAKGLIQRGSLFPYIRFDGLYRCPDFERKPRSGVGAQRLFNYTRSWAGRKALSGLLGDKDDYNQSAIAADDIIRAGKIVKMSQAYAPSAYWMMIDEQYNSHVGGSVDEFNPPAKQAGLVSPGGMPMCADVIHTIVGDEFGQYHGSKGRSVQTTNQTVLQQIPMCEQGSIAFYDGHVSLFREPLPGRHIEGADISGLQVEIGVVLDLVKGLIFSQRGIDTSNVVIPI